MTILDYGSSSSGEVVFGYYFAVVFFSHCNRNNNVCMCLSLPLLRFEIRITDISLVKNKVSVPVGRVSQLAAASLVVGATFPRLVISCLANATEKDKRK